MPKTTGGLYRRANSKYWWLKFTTADGELIRESTKCTALRDAEQYKANRLTTLNNERIYGVRPTVLFREAAEKYIEENPHLRALPTLKISFATLNRYIGDTPIDKIHDGQMEEYRQVRRMRVAAGTVNRELNALRRVLNRAARVWRFDSGRSYLDSIPMISSAKGPVTKQPYPLNWDEQDRMAAELPEHLGQALLFLVNTGLRQGEFTSLRWADEVMVPELGQSCFLLRETKNGCARPVLLNSVARQQIDKWRGGNAEFVFSYRGKPVRKLYNHAWRLARVRASIPQLRVHDTRHTFGHRLRAADVSLEDRRELLGHAKSDITTHYSVPDLGRLLELLERITDRSRGTVLRSGTAPMASADMPDWAQPVAAQ